MSFIHDPNFILDPFHFISRYKGPPELSNVYPMTEKIRGQCLIIDNEKFVNDVLPYREGSMIDSNNLDILFEQLGFKVIFPTLDGMDTVNVL